MRPEPSRGFNCQVEMSPYECVDVDDHRMTDCDSESAELVDAEGVTELPMEARTTYREEQAIVAAHGKGCHEIPHVQTGRSAFVVITRSSCGKQILEHSGAGERVDLLVHANWNIYFHEGWGYVPAPNYGTMGSAGNSNKSLEGTTGHPLRQGHHGPRPPRVHHHRSAT